MFFFARKEPSENWGCWRVGHHSVVHIQSQHAFLLSTITSGYECQPDAIFIDWLIDVGLTPLPVICQVTTDPRVRNQSGKMKDAWSGFPAQSISYYFIMQNIKFFFPVTEMLGLREDKWRGEAAVPLC